MPTVLGDLLVQFRADTSGLASGLAQGRSQVDQLVRSVGGQGANSLLVTSGKAEAGLTQMAGAAKQAGMGAGFLSGQMGQLATMAMGYFGAQALVNAAIQGFQERAADVTAVNRDIVTMDKLGMSTAGARDQIQQMGYRFMDMGQSAQGAFAAYQDLLQATGSVSRATQILNEALNFSVMWGENVQTVTVALTKAYEGQSMLLMRLLESHGLITKGVKDFATQEAALVKGGEGANQVLSDQQQAVFALRVEWKKFMDDFVSSGPAMNFIGNLKDLLEFWREWQIPEETGQQAEKASQQIHDARVAQHWEAGRMPAVDVTAKAPLTADEQATADKKIEEADAALYKKLQELELGEFDYKRWLAAEDYKKARVDGDNLVLARKVEIASLQKIDQDEADFYNGIQKKRNEDTAKWEKEHAQLVRQGQEEMKIAWEKSHDTELKLIDGTGQEFKTQIVGALVDGQFSVQDFEKSFLRMLLNIAMNGAWADISAKLRGMIPGYGSWAGGGGVGANDWAGGDTGGGGDVGAAGFRGGYRPLPSVPQVNVHAGSPTVNITVKGDVTRFGEFSEEVVTHGLTRMRKLGR